MVKMVGLMANVTAVALTRHPFLNHDLARSIVMPDDHHPIGRRPDPERINLGRIHSDSNSDRADLTALDASGVGPTTALGDRRECVPCVRVWTLAFLFR
jgi:hypothetical protein